MKVFLSWSGERSKAVAELLNDWLCCVLQNVRPWISARDLDRGSLWFGEISDQLKDTSVGIICLTQENKTRPWILFEAGALAKGLSTSRICTFLIDLKPKDIEDPLAQFNHTFPEKESIKGLVKTLNNSLGDSCLDHRILDQVFETYWPQFEAKFKDVISETKSAVKNQADAQPREDIDILGEILESTRAINNRVRRLESLNFNTDVSSNMLVSERHLFDKPFFNRLSAEIRALIIQGFKDEEIVKYFKNRAPIRIIDKYIKEIRIDLERKDEN
ncbi:toll/interleukin-1 receptor domain-containing protein [Actinobacillus equuli subsp. haemolyticus]|uniref:TIR domain-containing protein n=1 Tax=Actinobacillus equuli TaxID=718 RepID=UPI002446633C|nr:TIR domain-containing protein [Actinobacillus equuli]WGE51553.1 toll/interleukin-1 receptor domain-containing protein [Actinobacillus equuli subsp. haemolyticus]